MTINEATDDGPDDGPDDGAAAGAEGGATADPGQRKRRRRRRRGGEREAAASVTIDGAPPSMEPQRQAQEPRPQRQAQLPRPQRQAQEPRPQRQAQLPQPQPQRSPGPRERGRDDRNRDRGPRDRAPRDQTPRDPARGAEPAPSRSTAPPPTYAAPTPRLEQQQRRPPADDLEHEPSSEAPSIAWGTDDAGPPPVIVLAPDLPGDAPRDDADPVTYPLLDAPSAQLGEDVACVVGVRFMPGGRLQWCDAGDADYTPGERVLVDSDRGQRLAWVGTAPARKATRERGLRRVIRRANDTDLRGERSGDADRARALRIAKDSATALRLPLKVFRVELHGALGRGAKLNVYYTSDERIDVREFVRDVSSQTGARIELRQLGVRDEAKAVGGIGSCGLTLCCTTWMPDFVPVSIKMAKDQGLVLSPTKVAGQCGRLKCCLVYEQAAYAELRKGLPKLGKRVISPRGEGRVVEVDVLRQRIRVSYGMGDTEVLPATEVKPLFPAGNQPRAAGASDGRGHAHAGMDDASDEEAPALADDRTPTDDPSADHHGPTDDPSSDDHEPSEPSDP